MLGAETWFYFNHLRLYELALELGVDVAAQPSLPAAVAEGVCRPDGTVSKVAAAGSFMYADSDRAPLLGFMLGLLRAVLIDAPLRNISDYLDRGVLGCLVPGDVVFVQGLYTFSPQSPAPVGSQLSRGQRSANRVVVSFVFDLREGYVVVGLEYLAARNGERRVSASCSATFTARRSQIAYRVHRVGHSKRLSRTKAADV